MTYLDGRMDVTNRLSRSFLINLTSIEIGRIMIWFCPAHTSFFKTAESANQKQVRDVVNLIRCRDALVIGDQNATSPVF